MEKPDRPAVTSRPHGNDRIKIALTPTRILGRWIQAEWCITGKAFSKQVDDILWFHGVDRQHR